ncbi:hypothetical protein GGR26_000239 [Lewinella marina]|nr:hypothetical protein [Neolewinella marina]
MEMAKIEAKTMTAIAIDFIFTIKFLFMVYQC